MKISNLLEITPELKRNILWTLRTATMLENHLKGQHYDISIISGGTTEITIFDRHEGNLGFYVHRFKLDGSYDLDFINDGHTPEADMFEEAFDRKYHPERFEDESEDPE